MQVKNLFFLVIASFFSKIFCPDEEDLVVNVDCADGIKYKSSVNFEVIDGNLCFTNFGPVNGSRLEVDPNKFIGLLGSSVRDLVKSNLLDYSEQGFDNFWPGVENAITDKFSAINTRADFRNVYFDFLIYSSMLKKFFDRQLSSRYKSKDIEDYGEIIKNKYLELSQDGDSDFEESTFNDCLNFYEKLDKITREISEFLNFDSYPGICDEKERLYCIWMSYLGSDFEKRRLKNLGEVVYDLDGNVKCCTIMPKLESLSQEFGLGNAKLPTDSESLELREKLLKLEELFKTREALEEKKPAFRLKARDLIWSFPANIPKESLGKLFEFLNQEDKRLLRAAFSKKEILKYLEIMPTTLGSGKKGDFLCQSLKASIRSIPNFVMFFKIALIKLKIPRSLVFDILGYV